MEIPENLRYEYKFQVTEELVAKGIGLQIMVLSTPSLVKALEIAALKCVAPYLPNTHTTVGTGICIKHMKATPIGDEVTILAKLIKRDGPKLEFEVEAWDTSGKIAKGTHHRYIVEKEKFESKIRGMMK